MSLEIDQVQRSTEAALAANKEKPDFSEAFALLANNNQSDESKERVAFNQSLHKQFPDLNLVGQRVFVDDNNAGHNVLFLFDSKNEHIQIREANGFAILSDDDETATIKKSGASPEQAYQAMSDSFDKTLPQTKRAGKDASAEQKQGLAIPDNESSETKKTNLNPNADEKTKLAPNSNEKAKVETSPNANGRLKTNSATHSESAEERSFISYEVKPGDCLWNIAKAHLKDREHNSSAKISNASISSYVARIVEKNRDKIKNEDLIYPGQKFILPEIAHTHNSNKTVVSQQKTVVAPDSHPPADRAVTTVAPGTDLPVATLPPKTTVDGTSNAVIPKVSGDSTSNAVTLKIPGDSTSTNDVTPKIPGDSTSNAISPKGTVNDNSNLKTPTNPSGNTPGSEQPPVDLYSNDRNAIP